MHVSCVGKKLYLLVLLMCGVCLTKMASFCGGGGSCCSDSAEGSQHTAAAMCTTDAKHCTKQISVDAPTLNTNVLHQKCLL